ncbi:hypothetical protein QC763_0051390 [Podospora pseudopauciseta]|uniref:Uncharacterized protein n=2 Tax=Podospora TaxID=5144 RepID=A0ABR0HFL0_9PEZI|nr:hypothetical protein QC763_0051390 [Podospora pseudopauciseta]KAK4678039.1 hypothetical protein QC764_0051080 [Podospora pseudoanserina]
MTQESNSKSPVQFPTRARLLVTARKRVLFPAFGNPTKPTSANNLSSISISIVMAFSPRVANMGLRRFLDTKCGFPSPPRPPAAKRMGRGVGRERSR